MRRARRRRRRFELIEPVQAQVVRAPLHVGRGERDAERVAQRRNVLEEDLLLQILGAGRDQHALAAEDRRDEVGERLAGAGAGFGEQDAAVARTTRATAAAISTCAGARLEVGHRAARARRRARRPRRRPVAHAVPDTAGTSGTAPRLPPAPSPSAASSSGVCERARDELADRRPSPARACRAS